MTFLEMVHHLIRIRRDTSLPLTPQEDAALNMAIRGLHSLLTDREALFLLQHQGEFAPPVRPLW